MRILVAYDGSDEARRGLDVAASLQPDWLGLVGVLPTTGTAFRGGAVEPLDDVQTHEEDLAKAAGELSAKGVAAETIPAVGDPGHAICDIGKEREADLIVVGSRDRHGLKKLLMGSVSLYVVAHAHSDVYVVR